MRRPLTEITRIVNEAIAAHERRSRLRHGPASIFPEQLTLDAAAADKLLGYIAANPNRLGWVSAYTNADAVAAAEAEDPFDHAGVVNFAKNLNLAKSTETIDGNDEITAPTTSWVYLTSAGATDNLEGIGAGTEGQIAYLTPTAGKDITLVHDGTVTAGKKLMIAGEANVTLDEDHDLVIAIYDATAQVWVVLVPGTGGGNGGGGHNLLSATHPDTLADSVVAGDLIYGNATPKWARLAKGVANTVLWCDGSVPSWSAAPRLANIADTGGTNRVTLAASAPHVTLTGDAKVTGRLAVGGNFYSAYTNLTVYPAVTMSATAAYYLALIGASSCAVTASGAQLYGIYGAPGVSFTNGVSNVSIFGLYYAPGAQMLVSGTGTAAQLTGIYTFLTVAAVTGTMNVTYGRGLHVAAPNILNYGTIAITNYDGIHVVNPNQSVIATACGLRIEDVTSATTANWIAWLGGATPQVRVDGGGYAQANKAALVLNMNGTLYRVIRNAGTGALETEAA